MKFEPKDFVMLNSEWESFSRTTFIADIANAKLEEWLSAAHDVFGNDGSNKVGYIWTSTRNHSDTHKAKLVCIEQLDKP